MLEHTIIQYFLSSFLWTFCKPLLFTVTVNFLQTQDLKKEQKQKNSFAFHSQVWATRSHSWKKSWGSRCLKKRKKYNPDTIRRRISLLCGTHAVYSGWRNHSTPQKCTGRRSDPHRDAQASWNRIHSPSGCTKIWSCILLSAIWRTQIYSGSDTEAESDHDHTAVSSTVC